MTRNSHLPMDIMQDSISKFRKTDVLPPDCPRTSVALSFRHGLH